MGKQTRVRFDTAEHKNQGMLDYIHFDVCKPLEVISLGGFKYFMTIVDDYSRRVWVYYLMEKSKVSEKFKEWKAMVENQTIRK